MITDPKVRKFVDFYLSELLTHVKSMSEHRFTPSEYNLIKKVIVFIIQSPDHLSQVDKLSPVSTLAPFTGFLQKIVQKVQQPDFKKSQMISVIETDSEKLSQIFSQIVKNRDILRAMSAELGKSGIEFDPETLMKEPAKATEAAAEKIEKAPPVTAKKSVSEKPQPVIKENPPAVKPQILSASEFKKVDDMIGFLSKRKRKTVHESGAPEEIKKPAEPVPLGFSGGGDEGVASDAEDFFSEFREEFKNLESSITQLRTNLSRTRYLIELADSFGEFKRIGKIFELPRFSRQMHAVEKSLIDVADNADGKRSGMNEAAFSALQQMAVLFKEIELQRNFPLNARFFEEVHALHEQFISSVRIIEDVEKEEVRGAVKVEDVEAEIKQSSEADEEERIELPISGTDADDLQIFKDEARYTFDTIHAAVQKLKASGSDHDAIKDIQQSFRSLFTGSRLLRFAVLTGHFDLILKQLKTCIDSQNAIAPELLHLIDETLKLSSDLIRGEQIAEKDWNKLKIRLEKFGTQKELPTGETPAEFRIETTKAKTAETVVTEDTASKPADSFLASNENWIDPFQKTLESHPFELKDEIKEAKAKISPVVETKSAETRTVRQEPVKSATAKEVSSPKAVTAESVKGKEKVKSASADAVNIPKDLVSLMASGDVDLSDLELPSFAEKLNIEPQNIVGPTTKSGQKKAVGKKQSTPVSDKTASLESKPAESAKTSSEKTNRFVVEETNFGSIDPEILDIFNQEAEGYFKILDKSLGKLDTQVKDESALKDIERVSHSLKSSSRMLGLPKVSGLAGVIELIAERCNEKELEMTDVLKDVMRSTVLSITQLIERKSSDITSIIEYLVRLESQLSAPNIFIGNIPGASAIVAAGGLESTISESTASTKPIPVKSPTVIEHIKTEAIEIVPKQEEKKVVTTETKIESTQNYFTKIGVDEEIVEIFKEEAATYFKLITNSLGFLRQDPAHETAMRDIEKSAHSLRSSAKMLGFQKIGDVVKPIEVVAERINTGSLALVTNILDLFDDALTALKKLSDGIDVDITELTNRLAIMEKSPAQEVVTASAKQDSTQVFERIRTQLGDVPKEEKSMPKQSVSAGKTKSVKTSSKSQSAYFADLQLTSDPILKQLNKGASELLEEMSQSSTQ